MCSNNLINFIWEKKKKKTRLSFEDLLSHLAPLWLDNFSFDMALSTYSITNVDDMIYKWNDYEHIWNSKPLVFEVYELFRNRK